MMACSSITTCVKSVVNVRGRMGSHFLGDISRGPYCFYSLCSGNAKTKYGGLAISVSSPSLRVSRPNCLGSYSSKQRRSFRSSVVNTSIFFNQQLQITSFPCQTMKLRLLITEQLKSNSNVRGLVPASFIFGLLLVCGSSLKPVQAEARTERQNNEDEPESTHVKVYDGKKVYTDYSIIGIPGDGRCLFRSVAHGACIRSGRAAPSESLQKALADDLRDRVAKEFIKRREESEWFVEGDFESYVSEIRKPHVWGGEPELFMASHVLQMPITVYMHDKKAGGLISIAEYGQEYGKDNPVRVLYHGFGHYDALRIPGSKSRL